MFLFIDTKRSPDTTTSVQWVILLCHCRRKSPFLWWNSLHRGFVGVHVQQRKVEGLFITFFDRPQQKNMNNNLSPMQKIWDMKCLPIQFYYDSLFRSNVNLHQKPNGWLLRFIHCFISSVSYVPGAIIRPQQVLKQGRTWYVGCQQQAIRPQKA